MLSNMEVHRINELIGKVQGAKTSFKYLVASGKLTGEQFAAYCDLIDTVKELEKNFPRIL